MIKKLIKVFLIFLFFTFFFIFSKKEVKADCYWKDVPVSHCESHLGVFTDVCCHTQSGCSSGCGPLNWYDWCRDTGCNAYVCENTDSCSTGWWLSYLSPYGDCIEELLWKYEKQTCSAVDSCLGGADLHCGLCSSTGCSKCGGTYKICCNNVTGAPCSNSCTPYPGGNYQGVCGAGCHPHVPELGDGPCAVVKVACNGVCSTSTDCALKV